MLLTLLAIVELKTKSAIWRKIKTVIKSMACNFAGIISGTNYMTTDNALFTTQAIQHNKDLLLSAILFAGLTFDVFDAFA